MISLQQVVKTYSSPAGDFAALRGIDLEVGPGELVALVGKSGSGKSTLLNMIGGLDRPSCGTVVVGGTPLESLSEACLSTWRGATVGFVFQFFQLLPTLTVIENVMLPMDFVASVPLGQRRPRAMSLLERVGVAPHAAKLPAALSGGEQQRVAIARALANDPIVLLADEPTGNLDSTTAQEMILLLGQLSAHGKTVLVATHDADIGNAAHRSVELSDGRLTADCTAPQAAGEEAT